MKINGHQIKQYVKHFFTAKRNGHGVHSPFAFQLCEEVFYNQHPYYAFEELNLIRQQLLKDRTIIKMQEFGAGSKVFNSHQRQVKDIAIHGISNSKKSELIFKLINYLNLKNCIELGTSLGLNSLYMASVNKNNTVISIEGCEDLFHFAKKLGSENQITNIDYVLGNFDTLLPEIIANNPNFNFVFIDGNHTYEASIRYFELFTKKINPNTVIVFDDIYWSKGMTKAWEEIILNPKVKLSIDTFNLGLLFFREELKEKINLKFLV